MFSNAYVSTMTIAEAEKIFETNNAPNYLYSFRPPRSTDCLALEKRGKYWIIFNWEEGGERGAEFYVDEDSTAREFVKQVVKTTSYS